MSVVIVGAGHAGVQLAAALRSSGFSGGLTLVAGDGELPYQRPPLSKGFLDGGDETGLPLRPPTFYDDHDIRLVRDRVEAIDRNRAAVRLAGGTTIPYEQLVLATGARPRPLPAGRAGLADRAGHARHADDTERAGLLELRTLADARRLAAAIGRRARLVIAGGGFIGLEVAATMARRGLDVTIVESEDRLLARAVSEPTAERLRAAHASWGVKVRFGAGVAGIERPGGRTRAVVTTGGETVAADAVLVAIGVEPADELAAAAGLAVDNGIIVDEHLRTADEQISAIGDCARHPSRFSDAPVRIESVQNAADQARCLAARLTGVPAPYAAVPWFWSDQGDRRLQIAGLTAGHDTAVVTGDASSWSVFCFSGGRLRGVESVNRVADHMAARRLLAAGGPALTGLRPEDVAADAFDLKSHVKHRVVQEANAA